MLSTKIVALLFLCIASFILKSDATWGCIKRCKQTSELVCGTDGRTYQNICFLRNAGCTSKTEIDIAYFGVCGAIYKRLPGNLFFEPVCGSDGNTYSNIAFLRLSRCLGRRLVKSIFNGPCECQKFRKCRHGRFCVIEIEKGLTVCKVKCENERRQLFWRKRRRTYLVCASDGKTYTLERFNYLRCKSDSRITKVHYGRCKRRTCLIRNCPKVFVPVCGSDIRTYPNECSFQNEVCLGKKKTSNLRIINRGPCKRGASEVIIGSKYNPVCGSDGNKYYNLLALQTQQCVTDVAKAACKEE